METENREERGEGDYKKRASRLKQKNEEEGQEEERAYKYVERGERKRQGGEAVKSGKRGRGEYESSFERAF